MTSCLKQCAHLQKKTNPFPSIIGVTTLLSNELVNQASPVCALLEQFGKMLGLLTIRTLLPGEGLAHLVGQHRDDGLQSGARLLHEGVVLLLRDLQRRRLVLIHLHDHRVQESRVVLPHSGHQLVVHV